MAYAEREEHPPELTIPASGNAAQQVLRRFVSHALKSCDLFLLQPIQIGRAIDQLAVHKLVHQHIAQSLNVHGAAGREMADPSLDLGRALKILAPYSDLPFPPGRWFGAFGTCGRHLEHPFIARPSANQHLNDGGYDLARLLDQHAIANADILALNLALIVQRGATYDRSGH